MDMAQLMYFLFLLAKKMYFLFFWKKISMSRRVSGRFPANPDHDYISCLEGNISGTTRECVAELGAARFCRMASSSMYRKIFSTYTYPSIYSVRARLLDDKQTASSRE
jgi:hypothetical protein